MWSVPSVCLVQTRRLYRRPTAYKGVFSVNEFLSIKTILGALCLVSNSPNCIIQKVVKSVHLIGVSAVIAQSFFHLKYFEFSENKRRYRCLNLLNTATMATKVLQLETLWVTWHFGLLEKKQNLPQKCAPRLFIYEGIWLADEQTYRNTIKSKAWGDVRAASPNAMLGSGGGRASPT